MEMKRGTGQGVRGMRAAARFESTRKFLRSLLEMASGRASPTSPLPRLFVTLALLLAAAVAPAATYVSHTLTPQGLVISSDDGRYQR